MYLACIKTGSWLSQGSVAMAVLAAVVSCYLSNKAIALQLEPEVLAPQAWAVHKLLGATTIVSPCKGIGWFGEVPDAAAKRPQLVIYFKRMSRIGIQHIGRTLQSSIHIHIGTWQQVALVHGGGTQDWTCYCKYLNSIQVCPPLLQAFLIETNPWTLMGKLLSVQWGSIPSNEACLHVPFLALKLAGDCLWHAEKGPWPKIWCMPRKTNM